jgi:hypothetical protein
MLPPFRSNRARRRTGTTLGAFSGRRAQVGEDGCERLAHEAIAHAVSGECVTERAPTVRTPTVDAAFGPGTPDQEPGGQRLGFVGAADEPDHRRCRATPYHRRELARFRNTNQPGRDERAVSARCLYVIPHLVDARPVAPADRIGFRTVDLGALARRETGRNGRRVRGGRFGVAARDVPNLGAAVIAKPSGRDVLRRSQSNR